MTNLLSISDDYIDIFPLANLMLVAFPNFLIVGKPMYKNLKLFFEKHSYIKIRFCDIEIWYTFLCNVLLMFNNQTVSLPREIIISGKDFSYEYEGCTDLLNTFHIQIIINGQTSFERIEYFEKNEILYLLHGLSELNFKILCYPESIFSCFNYVVNHFLKIDNSIEEVSKNISMLTPSILLKLCDIFCKKNKTTENPMTVSQILFRHLVNLLITFRIKKSRYIYSSLLHSYQNL